MGFYVDLEMPKDCPMCPFANYDMFNTFSGCNITSGKRWAVKNDKDYAESSTRPDWCPLIEVPEPHGRLIDADALINEFKILQSGREIFGMELDSSFLSSGQELSTEWYCVEDAIEDAPTIIEAEEW